MNSTVEGYKKDFIQRLEECGIFLNSDYTLKSAIDIEQEGGESEWADRLRKNGKNPEYSYSTEVVAKGVRHHLVTYAIQGIIYHFQNRKWIHNDHYTYIMQGWHSFKFQHDKSLTD